MRSCIRSNCSEGHFSLSQVTIVGRLTLSSGGELISIKRTPYFPNRASCLRSFPVKAAEAGGTTSPSENEQREGVLPDPSLAPARWRWPEFLRYSKRERRPQPPAKAKLPNYQDVQNARSRELPTAGSNGTNWVTFSRLVCVLFKVAAALTAASTMLGVAFGLTWPRMHRASAAGKSFERLFHRFSGGWACGDSIGRVGSPSVCDSGAA
jgi:hypothetical protein